jgi:hypothetical protein
LIVPEIHAWARKIDAENCEKMKQSAAARINGSGNHRRNGLAHILDIVDVENRRVVDFEIIQKVNASRWGSAQGNSHGMEVEAMSRVVNR